MSGFLIYAEKPEVAAELVTFAKSCGKLVSVFALGTSPESFSNCGADKIVCLKGDSDVPENYARAAADYLVSEGGAELLLAEASVRGRDVAARIAGYMDCAMASDISTISYENGVVKTTRSAYGGAVVNTEEMDCFCVVTIPAGKFEMAKGKPEIVTVTVKEDTRVRLEGRAALLKSDVDIKKAEKVVCIGLGLKKEEDIAMARKLADALGAELACSRSVAEERHWLPIEQYIGISGVQVKSKLYLSMGVSGQVQHVFGIRDAGLIVAINTDEAAPIFRAADYGAVGDMYEIVPLLTEAIRKGKNV